MVITPFPSNKYDPVHPSAFAISSTILLFISIRSFSYADIVAFLVQRSSASCSYDIPAAFLISLILVNYKFDSESPMALVLVGQSELWEQQFHMTG